MQFIKQIDSRGRITLDQKLAGCTMLMDYRNDGTIVLRPVITVLAQEAWLWKNKTAMDGVQRGLRQAKDRKFVKGPNLDANSRLACQMGGK